MAILKNIGVFMPKSLYKILAVSILGVFYNYLAFVIISVYSLVLYVCLDITTCCCYILKPVKGREVETFESSKFECVFLSWLTITNLGRGKTAAVCRMVSSIFWTVAHTINITVILVICNNDPGFIDWNLVVWSELPLVQDLSTLNTLLISIICLGWGSLVLDVITAGVKYYCRARNNKEEQETSFWHGAILLEGLKY